MADKVHEYRGKDVIVRFDANRCIHSAECIRGLPAVFDTRRKRWIEPDNAEAGTVAEVVLRCPTGALHFGRTEGDSSEAVPDDNSITIGADGPLYLRGNIEIATANGDVMLRDTRVALCRCGASENKPICDNSHRRIGFRDAGIFIGEPVAESQSSVTKGKLAVKLNLNGPLLAEGPADISDSSGRLFFRGNKANLCRCGASNNKPFCDGSHKKVNFSAVDHADLTNR